MTSQVWQSYTLTVQVTDAGTSDVQMLTYDPTLSRVRVDVTAARDGTEPAGSTWTVQRSTDLVRWTAVRGGDGITVSATALPVDDYEFVPGVQNHYRAQVWSTGSLVHTYADSITPLIGGPWLKSVARPYLNRPVVESANVSDFTRPSRSGVFAIVGAKLPVAVTDARGGNEFSITLETTSTDGEADLDALIDSGDVLYLQTPPSHPIPTGYYLIGDTVNSWRGLNPAESPTRWLILPLTTVAAPDPSIVGATTNWDVVAATFATWDDLAAQVATWNDLSQMVAGTGDVVVDMA